MKESANYFQQEERFYFENLKSDDSATSIEQEKEAKIGQKKGIGIYYRYSSMEKSRTCVI